MEIDDENPKLRERRKKKIASFIDDAVIKKAPFLERRSERMYYADWLRVTAVHLVIFVHSMMNAADTVNL